MESKFLSSRRRDEMLRPTGLRAVPSVVPAPGRAFSGPDALSQLRRLVLGLRSALCVPGSEQWAEGVYLRREEGGLLVRRAKLVNPAFRQAIEGGVPADGGRAGVHWSKRTLQLNRVRPDLWLAHDGSQRAGEQQQQQQDEMHAAGAGLETGLDGVQAAACDQLAASAAVTAAHGADGAEARRGGVKAVSVAADGAGKGAGGGARKARDPARSTSTPSAPTPSCTWEPEEGPDPSAARLQLCGGGAYLALVGPAVDAAAAWALECYADAVPRSYVAQREARDGPRHHITLITPPEMEELTGQYGMDPKDVYDRLVQEVGPSGGAWLTLGLGRAACPEAASEALFLLVAWPAGRSARAALGLDSRGRTQHFHITLGFSRADVHDRPKGLPALVGGRVDPQTLQGSAEAVTAAGSRVPQHHQAAVLVLRALEELGTSPVTRTGSASAAAGGSPSGSTAGHTLAPATIEALRALLSAALEWTAPGVPPGGRSVGEASKGAPSAVELDAARRCFVAGCAHVALARLAGRCGELEEVEYHAQQAEGLAAVLAAAGARGESLQTVVSAAGASKAAASAGGEGTKQSTASCVPPPLPLPLPPAAASVLAAAAASLTGKAASQRGSFAAAAGAFERAATALSSVGLPDAASLLSCDPLSLLLRATEAAAMDAAALRSAAAACARRLAKEQGKEQAEMEQQQVQQQQQQQEQKLTTGRSGKEQRRERQGPGGEAPRCDVGGAGGRGWLSFHGLGGAEERVEPLDPRQRTTLRGVVARNTAYDGASSSSSCGDGGASGVGQDVIDVTLPRNTSWLVPGVLMGSSIPNRPEQIAGLAALGVGLVVTLTEEEPLPAAWFDTPHRILLSAAATGDASGSASGRTGGSVGGSSVRGGEAVPACVAARVRNLFVPVVNYEPPSVEQMDEILAVIESHVAAAAATAAATAATIAATTRSTAEDPVAVDGIGEAVSPPGVLVHCGGGKGRAGTVLACYLCKHGTAPPPPPFPRSALPGGEVDAAAEAVAGSGAAAAVPPAMSAEEAVRLVRCLRPGSIETEQQRRFVGSYCDLLWRRYDRAEAEAAEAAAEEADAEEAGAEEADAVAVAEAAIEAEQPPLQQQQQPQQQQHRAGAPARPAGARPSRAPAGLPRLAVLVGLPGSGKSTFARALEASGWWSRICQDECGSRGAAESAFSAAVLRGPSAGWRPHVVLDRCSPDAADRREWLRLALLGKRDRGIVAVFFDVDAATCKARVAARTDHPTIPYGRGGRIVDSFAARLQPPTTAEGFERVYVVRSAEDAEALLAAWGAGGLLAV